MYIYVYAYLNILYIYICFYVLYDIHILILHDWLVHLLCTFKNATLDRFNNSTTTEVLPGPGLRSWSCSVPAEEFLRAAEEHCPGWLRLNGRLPAHLPLQMANGRRFVVSIISEGNGSWWSMIYQYISMIVVLLLLLVLLFLLSMRF